MNRCSTKWSKMSVTTFFLAVRSSRRTTMPTERESMLVYRKPPPPTPSVQSPTAAMAAPSSPVRLNRASMVSLGRDTTDFTPTARWFSGSFLRRPASWAMKEFTPSAATTTWARSSSSPAWTPTTSAVFSVSTRSTRMPGMMRAPASSHLAASHGSSLARRTVTALTGSASLASL